MHCSRRTIAINDGHASDSMNFLRALLLGILSGIVFGSIHAALTIAAYSKHPLLGVAVGAAGYLLAVLFLTILGLEKREIHDKWGYGAEAQRILFNKYFLDISDVTAIVTSIGVVCYVAIF